MSGFGPILDRFSITHKENCCPSELFVMVNLGLLHVNNSLKMPPEPFKQVLGMPFSLNRPLGRFSQKVAMSVSLSLCVSVRHTLETTLPEGLEISGRRAYR